MDIYADYIVLQPRRLGQKEVTVTYDLIAAAPDLLTACELGRDLLNALRIVEGIGYLLAPGTKELYRDIVDQMDTALAKAKGTPPPR